VSRIPSGISYHFSTLQLPIINSDIRSSLSLRRRIFGWQGGHAVRSITAWNAWGRRSAAGARKGPMLPAVPVGAPSLASKGGWAGSFPPPHSCYPHMQPVYRRSAPPVSRGGAGGSPGGATPPIGRKTGRYPTRTRKDGGRGSGSPLTRAFAGSKPLRDQPLCPPLGILY
jgi:hypothetical protein